MNATEYDERYLAGVLFFNRGDFFEAHEVWESLWRDRGLEDRRYFQGLIQAAVSLYHAYRGNRAGCVRLFHSGRRYMSNFPIPYCGLDGGAFWKALESALAEFLREPAPPDAIVQQGFIPRIVLNPDAGVWPNPDEVLRQVEDRQQP